MIRSILTCGQWPKLFKIYFSYDFSKFIKFKKRFEKIKRNEGIFGKFSEIREWALVFTDHILF